MFYGIVLMVMLEPQYLCEPQIPPAVYVNTPVELLRVIDVKWWAHNIVIVTEFLSLVLDPIQTAPTRKHLPFPFTGKAVR